MRLVLFTTGFMLIIVGGSMSATGIGAIFGIPILLVALMMVARSLFGKG